MKNKEGKVNKRQFINGIILLFFLGVVCMLVYKVQIREKLYLSTEYTMMTEHKETSQVVLSEEAPELSEVFLCTVPELKSLSIQCTGKKIKAKTKLVMTLSDADTGEIYYQEEKSVKSIVTSGTKKKVVMELSEPIIDSAERKMLLTWQLKDAETTTLYLTANQKQFVVTSFNGQESDGTNVIYTLLYSDNTCMWGLYVFLCSALLIFVVMCYWMIVICRMNVEQFFLPMALVLGLIFQGVITVGGVPDEPGHLDTAYMYSNKILFIEDTENPGTIYKRSCDVKISDMLANGLESNSYYQLLTDTFKKPDNTELMEVSYLDSATMVPAIAYIPAAVGISVGRVLGLSAMLTFQLSRIFNLVSFVLLVWSAIKLLPFGKNLMAMIALLPISMQQGASASYDAMVNGCLFLFCALCFRLSKKKQKEKWELLLVILLILFIATAKGGAYLPILLILLIAFPIHRNLKKKSKKHIILGVFLGAVVVCVLLALLWMKFMPLFQVFLQDGVELTDSNALYTIPYLLQKPLRIIYIYWNTFVVKGAVLLQGFLGGILSWLDFKMSWLFEIVFLIGLLLMVNVDGDRYDGNSKQRILIGVSGGISVALIMMSMLVGYTKISLAYIEGLQGRYFLPLGPMLFFLTENKMVSVQKKQYAAVWMTMMVTEVMLILQMAAMV